MLQPPRTLFLCQGISLVHNYRLGMDCFAAPSCNQMDELDASTRSTSAGSCRKILHKKCCCMICTRGHPSHPTPAQLSTLDRFLNALRGNAVGQLQHFCSREKSTLYIVLYFSLLAPPVFPPNFDTVKNQMCAQILDGTFSLAPQICHIENTSCE